MTFKQKIQRFFISKRINVFVLFLILSFSFLLLTKFSKDYTQTLSFAIVTNNVPEEKVIVNDSTHKLNITLRTYGFKLLRYVFVKPKVEIDFSNLDKNEVHYFWTDKKRHAEVVNQFDTNVNIIAINPDTLRFRYDENYVKSVPVILDENIKYAAGYDLLDQIILSPDSIRVIGPKVVLDSINYMSTISLNLKGVNRNISTKVALLLPKNTDQVSYSNASINIEGKVDKFTEGELDIPVTVINVPKDISLSYFPKTVKVFFYTSLKDYNKIKADNFQVECNYKALKDASNFLVPKVVLKPKFVKNVRLNINKIDYIIKQ